MNAADGMAIRRAEFLQPFRTTTLYHDILDMPAVLEKQLKVMDSTAFSLCMDNKMPIIVFDFFKTHNLRRVVLGEDEGTLVHV